MTLAERVVQLLKEAGSTEEWLEDIRGLVGYEYPSEDADSEDFEDMFAHQVATDIAMRYDLDIEIPDMAMPNEEVD